MKKLFTCLYEILKACSMIILDEKNENEVFALIK